MDCQTIAKARLDASRRTSTPGVRGVVPTVYESLAVCLRSPFSALTCASLARDVRRERVARSIPCSSLGDTLDVSRPGEPSEASQLRAHP
jgi:hypothetical protein